MFAMHNTLFVSCQHHKLFRVRVVYEWRGEDLHNWNWSRMGASSSAVWRGTKWNWEMKLSVWTSAS